MEKSKNKILNTWIKVLDNNKIKYVLNEENATIRFNSSDISDFSKYKPEIIIKAEDKSYCAYAELPVIITEETLDGISSYVFKVNKNPLCAHFTLDLDSKSVFCTHGTFCGTDIPDKTVIATSLGCIGAFLDEFYKGLKSIAEKNISAEVAYEKNSD